MFPSSRLKRISNKSNLEYTNAYSAGNFNSVMYVKLRENLVQAPNSLNLLM